MSAGPISDHRHHLAELARQLRRVALFEELRTIRDAGRDAGSDRRTVEEMLLMSDTFPNLPAEINNVPAVIDQIEQQLAEARTLPEVKGILDRSEALRFYAQKRGAAVEAQNGCARLVALAERQIGAELAKAQDGGGVSTGGRPSKALPPVTVSDLGMNRKQANEYKQLAKAPIAVINRAVAEANAEQRPVTKADIKRAVKEALGQDPRPTPSKTGRQAKELQVEATPGLIGNAGPFPIAHHDEQDGGDQAAWLEILRGLEVLAHAPFSLERVLRMTADDRLDLTLEHARRAAGFVQALISALEKRFDDEAA